METSLALRLERKLEGLMRRLILGPKEQPSKKTPKKYQEWSIGIYTGPSPFDLTPLDPAMNPVLTHKHVSDVPASFVADPFMLRVNHAWYMFFEVMNKKTCQGEIGLAISEDALHWTYKQIVLREPFHLSYPYVFEWDNEYYMIPETYRANSVRLYRAVDFPTQWSFVETLIKGNPFTDPSAFHFNDKWWLMTDIQGPPFYAGTLRLFYADRLLGRWFEHPKSPIIADNPHIARPAGRVLTLSDRAIRYTQDCYPDYGTRVRGFEIKDLTTTSYQEQEVDGNPVLAAAGDSRWNEYGSRWNECGMHHVDPHVMDDGRWIACVDGCVWRKE